MKRTKRVWNVTFTVTDDLNSPLTKDYRRRTVLYTKKALEESIRYIMEKEFSDLKAKNITVSDASKDQMLLEPRRPPCTPS